MKKLLLVAMSLACSTASASEWIVVAHSHDGKQSIFVDVSSIRIDGPIRRFWDKLVPAPRSQTGAGQYAHKYVSDQVARALFNCSELTRKHEALIFYWDDGTNYTMPPAVLEQAGWEPVAPDTLVEAEMRFVCSWKP